MLTEISCKAALCPTDKPRTRFSDAGGLYLEVASNGSKRWFWKYRFGPKEKRLAIGSYPEVKLKAAREARDDARKLLRNGTDPAQQRQLDKATAKVSASITYESVAREFHNLREKEWSAAHHHKWLRLQEVNLFPWIGSLPLADINAPILLATLRRVEKRGVNQTAHYLRQYAGQVFRYGMATGRCTTDPAHALREALQAVIVKNMGAVLEPKQAGELLRAIDVYNGQSSPPRIVYHPASAIDKTAVAQVPATLRRRILRAFVGRGLIEKADAKEMLAYQHSGFSVDEGECIEAYDGAALERLLRYCAHPPFAMDRLRNEGAALVYRCAK
jgi:hypothetical protein